MSEEGKLGYTRLDPGGFRILVIRRSKDPSADIHCRLVCETIPGNTPYGALSYTWGTEPPNRIITVNDTQILVRENLYHALFRLRRKKNERRIWVDALCINQLDIEERNSQVRQMKEIYTSAKEVAIWLGEDDEKNKAQEIFRFIPRFRRYLQSPSYSRNSERFRKLTSRDFLLKVFSLTHLLSRPWWDRIWVLQEAVVAKQQPFIYFGAGKLDWGAMGNLILTIFQSGFIDFAEELGDESVYTRGARLVFAMLFDGVQCFTSLIQQRVAFSDATPQTLSDLLWETRTHKSTDPRDRVFALLGLVNPPIQFPVDYNLGLDQVNVFTMTHILLERKDLCDFARISEDIERSDQSNLPSWVYDFGKPQRRPLVCISTKIRNSDGLPEDQLYSASQSLKFTVSPRFESEGRICVLNGIRLEPIERLGHLSPDSTAFLVDGASGSLYVVLENWKWVSGIYDAAESEIMHMKEVFWKTILLDRGELDSNGRLFYGEGLHRLDHGLFKVPQSLLEEKSTLESITLSHGAQFGKRFMVTSSGSMGIVPKFAAIGDIICVLDGGEVPFVLRPVGEGHYKLIGECYVDGIMDGEVIEDENMGKYKREEIRLI